MRKPKLTLIFMVICIIILIPATLSAHPGRTDKYGGHTDKSTGLYHFHNPDGTITYGEKPANKVSSANSSSSETSKNGTEENTVNNSATSIQSPKITVDGEEKDAPQNIQTTPTSPQQLSKDEIIVEEVNVPDENQSGSTSYKQEIYTYLPVSSSITSLNTVMFIIIVLFAIIGLCMVSGFCVAILSKYDKKHSKRHVIFDIICAFIWLPSLVGNFIYSAYNKLIDTDKYEE